MILEIQALSHFKNDFAEDVAGGLDKICHLDWQSPTRILFHTCDSPAHGRKYHGQHYDEYVYSASRVKESARSFKLFLGRKSYQIDHVGSWFV